MRVRTLEIRWHDSKPISTCDFQPAPFKKARPAQDRHFPAQAYRLATGGEDNHVRVSPPSLPPACHVRRRVPDAEFAHCCTHPSGPVLTDGRAVS